MRSARPVRPAVCPPDHGGTVTIRLLAPGGSLLQTRCAGPLDGDLASVSPAVDASGGSSCSVAGSSLDLSGTPHVRLPRIRRHDRLDASRCSSGKPQRTVGERELPARDQDPPSADRHRAPEPGPASRGGLSATVQGTTDPIVCGLLDSCGLSGTLSLGGGVRGTVGPGDRERVRRAGPYGDFLAALGLSRSGRARGIARVRRPSPGRDACGPPRARPAASCTDTAATGAGGRCRSAWEAARRRSRVRGERAAPDPSLGNAQPVLAGVARSSPRWGTVSSRSRSAGRGCPRDDGYVIVAHGRPVGGSAPRADHPAGDH